MEFGVPFSTSPPFFDLAVELFQAYIIAGLSEDDGRKEGVRENRKEKGARGYKRRKGDGGFIRESPCVR